MGRPMYAPFSELIVQMEEMTGRTDLGPSGLLNVADDLLLNALYIEHEYNPTDEQLERFVAAYKRVTNHDGDQVAPIDMDGRPWSVIAQMAAEHFKLPTFHVDTTQPYDKYIPGATEPPAPPISPTPEDLEARFGLDSYLPIHYEQEWNEDSAAFRARITLEHEHHWRDTGTQIVTDATPPPSMGLRRDVRPRRYDWQGCVHCGAKRGFRTEMEARQ